ncbi:MAG: helix-turn-helix domain-containing protein [Candidatus Riflebacteria bacterium]|nr:helix-turn-helix domain-containing protein [Candidatus Riflebacteria bacterium]
MKREDVEEIRDALIKAAVKRWFSVREGAAYLGISSSKLYKMLEAGKVKHHLVDSKIILSREDLDRIPIRPQWNLDETLSSAVSRLRKQGKEL